MNKLDFSISLREKGLGKNEMIAEMKNNGFDQAEIDFYLKKSDEIYLTQLINNKQTVGPTKSSRTAKSIALFFSFIFLLGMFFGYVSFGLIGLIFIWSLLKFGSYRR